MSLRFPRELDVDDPAPFDAGYQLDAEDRRRIDNQILALEQTFVDLLIRGRMGSWFKLHATSAALVAGDVFVAAPDNRGYVVTKATSASLAAAGMVAGIAIEGVTPGNTFRGVCGGLVPPSITGLGAASGLVRVNPATGRCQLITGSVLGVGAIIGMANAAGVLALGFRSPQEAIPNATIAAQVIAASGGLGWTELARWAVTDLVPTDDRIADVRIRLRVSDAAASSRDLVAMTAAVHRLDATPHRLIDLDHEEHSTTTLPWELPLVVAGTPFNARLAFNGSDVILEGQAHATSARTVSGRVWVGSEE